MFSNVIKGSSNWPRVIRQTGPMSSGVVRNSGPLQIIYPSWTLPLSP